MSEPRTTLSIDEARRIALAAQGFAERRPKGLITIRHLRRVFDRIGMLQLDSINVLVRSHYLPLFSRLGPYPLPLLDRFAYERKELFEYWGHAASLLPLDRYPVLRHRMAEAKPRGRVLRVMEEHPDYIEQVLAEVRQRGPLSVSDLEDPGQRTGPWWGHGRGKVALEWLFLKGDLAVRTRRNFTRIYDLTERVIPSAVLSAPALSREEAHREMLRFAARAQGVATARDLGDYYRIRGMSNVHARLQELVENGELQVVGVEGWNQPAYLHPHAVLPRRMRARALLSPFDSLIWTRDRLERLFGLRYSLEVYVPQQDRRYGYYVLPFLLGETFAGRVDLKAQRDTRTLLVRSANLEDGRQSGPVAVELAKELQVLAQWLDLDRVDVNSHGDLAGDLKKALGEHRS